MIAPGFDATILARDENGHEHRMRVSHHMLEAGLVVLTDDGMLQLDNLVISGWLPDAADRAALVTGLEAIARA